MTIETNSPTSVAIEMLAHPDPDQSSMRPLRPFAMLVFLVAVILFLPTMWFDFTFDDHKMVLGNPVVQNREPLLHAMTRPTFPGDLYRPAVLLSFAITNRLVGNNPFLYHLTNVVLHASVAVAVLLVLAELFPLPVASVAAAFFAIHPIHNEVVANVYNRTESMSSLFGLLALALALRTRRTLSGEPRAVIRSLPIICVLFLLALLSKESSLSLLLLAPLSFALQAPSRAGRNSDIVVLAALLATALIYIVIRVWVLGAVIVLAGSDLTIENNVLGSLPPTERIVNALVLLGRYATLLLFPFPLSADYSFASIRPITTPFGSETIANISALAIVCIATLWIGVRRSKHVFWALWFFAAFAVTSNVLFPIGTVFAERLAYLPSVSICGMLAVLLTAIPSKSVRQFVVLMVSGAFLWLTYSQYAMWRNDITMLRSSLSVSPNSVKLLSWNANALAIRGRFEEAAENAESVLRIMPNHKRTLMMMPNIYLQLARYAEADTFAERALAEMPDNLQIWSDIGWIRLRQGRTEEAEHWFKRTIAREPQAIAVAIGLFAVRVKAGDLEGARAIKAKLPPEAKATTAFEEFDALLVPSNGS